MVTLNHHLNRSNWQLEFIVIISFMRIKIVGRNRITMAVFASRIDKEEEERKKFNTILKNIVKYHVKGVHSQRV